MLVCWCIQQLAGAFCCKRCGGSGSLSSEVHALLVTQQQLGQPACLQPAPASLTALCSSCADVPAFFMHMLWANSLTRNQDQKQIVLSF